LEVDVEGNAEVQVLLGFAPEELAYREELGTDLSDGCHCLIFNVRFG